MGVIYGINDSGQRIPVPATSEGHLEIAIHSPRGPFGSVLVENLRPIVQKTATYGVDTVNNLVTTNASGTVTGSNQMWVCQTGTTIYGAGSLSSRKRVNYRPGQGIIGRFTAMFTSGVASSYQVVGIGNSEDSLSFGYVGTSFGILYGSKGAREVRTLTITTKSSNAENAVVTLNGTATNVAVTNGASTVTTAYEISKGTYAGWKAESIGSTVVFISDAVGAKSGSYSVSGTSVLGSFAQTKAGVALTEVFVPQTSWTGDKLNGDGASGITIDPTKLNVFQIDLQYLGAGAIVFKVEVCHPGNNPDFVTVHTIDLPNTLTTPSFGNPGFAFLCSAYSAGSTTNLTVKSASYALFVEGQKIHHGNRYSFRNTSTGVGSGSYLPLFTIRNTRYFGGMTNQQVVNFLSIGGANKHTSPVELFLFRDATLTGSPNFTQYSTGSASYVDTAATACSITDNYQLIWSGQMSDSGNIVFHFTDDITIQPGETMTLAARSVTGTPSYVNASLNIREDG